MTQATEWAYCRYIHVSQKVILMDLCEFVGHCNKRHIFLCLFVPFAHYYQITGRNEAIIVELKTLFALNMLNGTFSGGSHH